MKQVVLEIADKITKAYDTMKPIDFIRHSYSLNEETAYAVQEEFIARKCKLENEKIAGYKISMTSPETQAIAQTNEPAYGTLLSANLVNSSETISLSELFAPLLEPELMFILTDDLSLGASEDEILANSKIAAGLEIPDSRYMDWFPNFSLADLISDNTATGRVIVSDMVDPPSFEELANIKMKLFHNGENIGTGISSEVLGNPASSVAWLTKKLSSRNQALKKGMVISSGTFIPPLSVEPGKYQATYSHFGTAEITFLP
ncbi:2-keto-4-pentenoate hydratase [Oceanobacillus massiliensis]|uniref:2-keto-4-pentenoate hydratase n=1 Tax=Oceanobacillus massiliensis TaxID=1465765 RepID=UPI000289A039